MKRISLILVATALMTASGAAWAQHAGHGHHPPMPGQEFVIRCGFEQGREARQIEVPLGLASPMMPADLTQVIELPRPFAPIKVTQYLPQATLKQSVVPGAKGEGQPAVLLSIEGPTQTHQRWLIADDTERNRLTSFIGTWRYMAVDDQTQRDALFAQFETESSRDPRLVVSVPNEGAVIELPVKEGHVEKLGDNGVIIRVRRFYPDFAFDKRTGQGVSQSDKRLNPAALVEIEYAGRKAEHWVFARYPDFHIKEDVPAPIRVRLDCPIASERPVPSFVVLTIDRTKHEVWSRHEQKTSARPLNAGEQVDIPDSKYVFRIAEFHSAGKLVESYGPAGGQGAAPAVCIQATDSSGEPVSVWLESGRQRVIRTPDGPVTVAFGSKTGDAAGVHP